MINPIRDSITALPPRLWHNGSFPTLENYQSLTRRGKLLYSLDLETFVPPAGPGIASRPCNLLYHTALTNYMVPHQNGGTKGIARNELLLGSVESERDYSRSLHAVGIPVIVYQNDNNFDESQFSKEESLAMSAELEPFAWGFDNPGRRFACLNKSAWRNLLVERLKIRVGDYETDGVFLDNNTPFIHCRCQSCQELYREALGRELLSDMGQPETVVADMRVFDYVGSSQLPRDLVPVEDSVTMHYLMWRVGRAIDFYKTLRNDLESAIGRKIIFTSNGHIGIAEQSGVMLSGVFDMYFSEDGYTAPPVSNSFNLRLGSAMTNGEGCPFIITRVTESAPTPDMAATLTAEGRALGGQADFWDFHYRDDDSAAASVRAIRNFHIHHADTLFAVEKDFNEIAVLYSWQSDLWTSAADSPAKMMATLLEDLNQPYDVLIAEKPEHKERLASYALVIVPHVELLSDDWFDTIQSYLDSGGKVISTGNTALLDENCAKRSAAWVGSEFVHFDERLEKVFARSRKQVGLHHAFTRPTGELVDAIDRMLPSPSVRLEPVQPLITINHTRLDDGEAVHLVNRFCNVFPRVNTEKRRGLVLHLRPLHPAARITWISPGMDAFDLDSEMENGATKIELPTLNHTGIVRVFWQ